MILEAPDTEIITLDDRQRQSCQFWSQDMEFVTMVCDGKNWHVVPYSKGAPS